VGDDGAIRVIRRPRRRIRRNSRGGYDLQLPEIERALLENLPAQFSTALDEVALTGTVPDELRRLFPSAYPRDDEAEFGYQAVTRGELVAHHQAALTLLARTAQSQHLSEEEADGWIAALNDLRLALGTRLGVTEELREVTESDDDYPDWICYQYLSYLQTEAIEAMSGALPPPRPSANETLPEDPWGDAPGGLRWDGTPRPPES
jgi:Domain of unknown function (DUF2017)